MTFASGASGFGGTGSGMGGSARDLLDRCQCYSCRRMREATAAMGVAPRKGGPA